MNEAKVAGTSPAKLTVEAGNHAWCACGQSKGQPYCDGSHNGGPFRPVLFAIEQPKEVFLCLGKATKNPPYCDGSHKALRAAQPAEVSKS
jgi:CDGSH iron-sulfur domain-containing protein 3